MSLSANKVTLKKHSPYIEKLDIITGAVTIYQGANLEYSASDAGYVQPATADQARGTQPTFAGIAVENKTLTSTQNTAHGANQVQVLTPGSGEIIQCTTSDTITRANEGQKVYMNGDDKVICANPVNTTHGLVGIIRRFIDGNTAWVQLTQMVS